MANRQTSMKPVQTPDQNDESARQPIRSVGGQSDRPDDRSVDIAALADAAINGGRDTCLSIVEGIIERGISRDTIADDYIPAIARQMGDAWCLDEMSFAAVTIGVSRLQSLLRDLGPEWRADSAADPQLGAALIVVALDEFHTLGAMVLAGRLRRLGLSVQLQMGLEPGDLRRQLDPLRFDAVLISASRGEDLDSLRLMVEAIRNSGSPEVPVVIGGSVCDQDVDIAARTGADLATNDPGEALDHCGLRIPITPDAPHAPGP